MAREVDPVDDHRAVDSSRSSWDIISRGMYGYGHDVAFIDAALLATLNEVNVDPTRMAVQGFSQGASHALAVNGALFSRVTSFSAGYIAPYSPTGKPKFFMPQGVDDNIFDITQTGDFINQKLVAAGYDVDYAKFNGVHEVPDAIVQQAIAWLAS